MEDLSFHDSWAQPSTLPDEAFQEFAVIKQEEEKGSTN